MPELTQQDVYLFKEGTLLRAYEKLGAHRDVVDGHEGTRFAVWAPNAAAISLVGDFNEWSRSSHLLQPRSDQSGIWELFVPKLGPGTLYKYHISSRVGEYRADK